MIEQLQLNNTYVNIKCADNGIGMKKFKSIALSLNSRSSAYSAEYSTKNNIQFFLLGFKYLFSLHTQQHKSANRKIILEEKAHLQESQ